MHRSKKGQEPASDEETEPAHAYHRTARRQHAPPFTRGGRGTGAGRPDRGAGVHDHLARPAAPRNLRGRPGARGHRRAAGAYRRRSRVLDGVRTRRPGQGRARAGRRASRALSSSASATWPPPPRQGERGDHGLGDLVPGRPGGHPGLRHRRSRRRAPRVRATPRTSRPTWTAGPYADHGRLRRGEVDPGHAGHAGAAGDAGRHRRRFGTDALPRLLPLGLRLPVDWRVDTPAEIAGHRCAPRMRSRPGAGADRGQPAAARRSNSTPRCTTASGRRLQRPSGRGGQRAGDHPVPAGVSGAGTDGASLEANLAAVRGTPASRG